MAKKEEQKVEEAVNVTAAKEDLERLAFERVCKALGTTPEEIDALEKNRAETQKAFDSEPEVEYDVSPIVVSINGNPYPSRGRVKRSVAEVILQAAGAKRNRLLEEKFGKTNELIMMRDGTLQAKIVETIDLTGMKVSRQ